MTENLGELFWIEYFARIFTLRQKRPRNCVGHKPRQMVMKFYLIIYLTFVAAGEQCVLGDGKTVPLSASVLCADTYKPSDEHASCLFDLRNNGNDAIFVLHWFTPLNGLHSDCMNVNRDGKSVRYDGRLVKRAYPASSESFIKIDAGTSVSANFYLSDGYSTKEPGTYTVSVDIFSLQYYHEGSLEYEKTGLDSPQVTFTVNQKAIRRMTMGEKQRMSEIAASPSKVGEEG